MEQRSWGHHTPLTAAFLRSVLEGREGERKIPAGKWRTWGWQGDSRFGLRTCKQAGTTSFLHELQPLLGETAKLFTKQREASDRRWGIVCYCLTGNRNKNVRSHSEALCCKDKRNGLPGTEVQLSPQSHAGHSSLLPRSQSLLAYKEAQLLPDTPHWDIAAT